MEIPPNLTPLQQKALDDHAQALANKKTRCCNSGACMECGVYRLGRRAVQAGISEDLIKKICKEDAEAREATRAQAAERLQSEPTIPTKTHKQA